MTRINKRKYLSSTGSKTVITSPITKGMNFKAAP